MSPKTKPTHELPGGQTETPKDDGIENDSLGTVDPADSTGLDENEQTGNAERADKSKRDD